MSKQRLQIEQLPTISFYVKRTLAAMAGAGGPDQAMADFRALAQQPFSRQRMLERLGGIDSGEPLDAAMRVLRRDVLLGLIARDCTGLGSYEEVVAVMTALAETCVSAAVRVHSRELALRYGVPSNEDGEPQDLMVVGMGKLGGAELNVSSDIDLIFLYDEAGTTRAVGEFAGARRSVSNHEFFEKLSKRVITALDSLQGNGFVFRVDMRLRPFGDGGPIVVSSEMLEQYLYTEGRDWERFAWLKGRVVNTPVFSQPEQFALRVEQLNALIRPFVYRKYVDFSAISALSRLHEMIRAETARREAGKDRGINVKLGRGGIREIEFITQTFQIIRGGRDASLRGRQTLVMLEQLVVHGGLAHEVAQRLTHGYVFLRNVEHALQYMDDQQTQRMPVVPEEQDKVAALLGLTRDELLEQLDSVRRFVAETFDGIFHTEQTPQAQNGWPVDWQNAGPSALEGVTAKLRTLGYGTPEALAGRVIKTVGSRLMASRSSEAKEQFTRFVVTIAENAHDWSQLKTGSVGADELFIRYLNLLEVIAGRSTYIALLNQYPATAAKVGRVLAVSGWAAEYLNAHPILLDELVDGRVTPIDDFTPVDWSSWLEDLREQMREADQDQERQLNLLRDAHHSAVFHLLLADLDAHLRIERLADQLSALTDAVLQIVMELAWNSIATRHCETPRFAVIGYGKLGGKELGYASDLDIIFLYDDNDPRADANYVKLVRRMLSWLTMQTSSGKLFDVDMRLRPNGQNGLVASNLEMFRRYQRNLDGNGAWEWEHQALTRARFCAGDPEVGSAFEQERLYILQLERQPQDVARSIVQMRAKMLEGHPNRSDLFDIKHDRGGMVDIEFIVQRLVLTYGHTCSAMLRNFGNTLLLEIAAQNGLIDAQAASRAVSAYRHYRMIQRDLRLSQGQNAVVRVPAETVAEDTRAVLSLWEAVFGTREPERV